MELIREGVLKKIQMNGCTLCIPSSFIHADLGIPSTECKYAGVITNQRIGKYPNAPEFYFFYKQEKDIWSEGFEESVWKVCGDISPLFKELNSLTLSALKDGEEYGSNLELPAFGIHPIDDFKFYDEQTKYDPNFRMPYDAIIF